MFKIFRFFSLAFFYILSFGVMAGNRLDDEINQYSKRAFEVRKNESQLRDSIKQIDSKLLKKLITSAERKDLLKQREDNIINKWKSKSTLKKNNHFLRHLHSKRLQKMDLKVSPKGVCKSPCLITIEAIANKKIKPSISKYYFYINDKKIESLASKISTTIFLLSKYA